MLLKILSLMAIFAICVYVIYKSCKCAESEPEVSSNDFRIPAKHAIERLEGIPNVNKRHVYDSIRADMNFNVPDLCSFGCTGERLIQDLGDSAPEYDISVLDNAVIRGCNVSLLRYIPKGEDHLTFYELKIKDQNICRA